MTEQSNQLKMFIVDVLRHNQLVPLSSVLSLLNADGGIGWRRAWPHDFSEQEVVPAILELIGNGFVTAHRFDMSLQQYMAVSVRDPEAIVADSENLWFGLEDRGRDAWEAWEDYPTFEEEE